MYAVERRYIELLGIDSITHLGAFHGHRYLYDRIRDFEPQLGEVTVEDRPYQPNVEGVADDSRPSYSRSESHGQHTPQATKAMCEVPLEGGHGA